MVNLFFVGVEEVDEGTDHPILQFELRPIIKLELRGGLHDSALDADGLHLGIAGRHDQLIHVVLAGSDLLNIAEATVPTAGVDELGANVIGVPVFVELHRGFVTLLKTRYSLAHTDPIYPIIQIKSLILLRLLPVALEILFVVLLVVLQLLQHLHDVTLSFR